MNEIAERKNWRQQLKDGNLIGSCCSNPITGHSGLIDGGYLDYSQAVSIA